MLKRCLEIRRARVCALASALACAIASACADTSFPTAEVAILCRKYAIDSVPIVVAADSVIGFEEVRRCLVPPGDR